MSEQSNAAAERSAHVERGQARRIPGESFLIEVSPGVVQLKAVVEAIRERDAARAEIDRLRAALRNFDKLVLTPSPRQERTMQTTETLSLPPAAMPFSEMATIDANMTCRQVAVLLMIEAHPGNSVKHLAAALDLSKPVITRATDKLVELGLITRTTSKADRREVELTITRLGELLLNKAGLWLG